MALKTFLIKFNFYNFRPEPGRAGFLVWRYLLRRDDPNPAPWEAGAKKYQCIVPESEKPEADGDSENPSKKIKMEDYVVEADLKALIAKDEVQWGSK